MNQKVIFSLLILVSFIIVNDAIACSLAVIHSKDKFIIARNMDWMSPNGYAVKNYPCVSKKAKIILIKPYTWTSKYGSISLNLEEKTHIPGIGNVDFPGCGINEKGLCAAALWVIKPPAVKYPVDFKKEWLSTAEVVQVLLDTCSTVDEAIARFNEFSLEGFNFLRWIGLAIDLHWFISDSSGKAVVLEYPNAQVSVHNYPHYLAMTNHFYERSHEELNKYKAFGGINDIPDEVPFDKKTSLMRFILTYDSVVKIQNSQNVTIDSGFNLLKRVSTFNSPVLEGEQDKITTQWSVVYDAKEKTITWISSQNPSKRFINLNKIKFPIQNIQQGKRISVQSSDKGDITNIFQN